VQSYRNHRYDFFFEIVVDPTPVVVSSPRSSVNNTTNQDDDDNNNPNGNIDINQEEVVNAQSSIDGYDMMEDDGYADGAGNERTRSISRRQPLLGIT